MKNKKKILIAILGILGIVLTTVGVTVAWFTYSRAGTKENTITTGSIKFHYAEGSRTIDVDDMMPMTDAQGKAQDDYFEFTITSDTSRTLDIPYYITARRTNASDANMDSIVKVYLTKVDDNGNETQVLLSKFSGLSGYLNSKINIPASEKTLYNDTVLAGTTGYTQKYRLRMWIDYDAKYIVQEENEPDQYPLENKSYALTVNVYGEGNDIGESGKTARENTNIASMSIGSTQIPTTDGANYNTTLEVASTDDIPTSMVVETEGAGATVIATKVNTTGALIEESKIKRLSSTVNVPLPDLTLGTNNYIITVTSFDKTKTETYNLTVTVEIKQPESFATDSWNTIIAAVKANNTSVYAPKTNNNGNKEVTLTFINPETGEQTVETHYLRVANTSTPSVCSNSNYSQTACGFVIEFADIISLRSMNDTDTNAGGYSGSQIINYVNETIYNALPEEIRNLIINTNVISGHPRYDTNPAGLPTSTNNNYINYNQKLYLLDRQEVLGDNSSYNTAAGYTRLLDYYSLKNVKAKNNHDAAEIWWLRSSTYSAGTDFDAITTTGTYNHYAPSTNYGVSPAFRIG